MSEELAPLIALTGGGTGGHIYPAIAVAQELSRRGQEVVFYGTASGMESRIIPSAGFPYVSVPACPFKRGQFFQNLGAIPANGIALIQAMRALARRRPCVVAGFGGFVSAPIGAAAVLRGIPLVLHEQNAVPGLVNRLLVSRAEAALAAWPIGGDTRWDVVGMPVRRDFAEASRSAARSRLGISEDRRMVLVFGGSQGSAAINSAIRKLLQDFDEATVYWVMGREKYDASLADEFPGHFVVPYEENMPEIMAAADLAVTRAGAMTLAELSASSLPAVLIPYPYAAENHQEKNARSWEEHDAAVVIRDKELDERLRTVVSALLSDRARLEIMAERAGTMGKTGAAETISDIIMNLAE